MDKDFLNLIGLLSNQLHVYFFWLIFHHFLGESIPLLDTKQRSAVHSLIGTVLW